MTRPAAPGPRVGGGRIRVDAARAIAKLREYQLVERAAWVLEGIRAAVAARATDIVLDGDSNDIWLSWRGEPWPAEDLTRLFDELVSPEAASERHHVRLLAAAVNSALGLAPAHVDVIAVHDDHAIRARYTPDVLDDPGVNVADSALRNMTTEKVAVPDGARRGMRVHLRRRASLEVLSYLFGEPPELDIARRACVDVPVLLAIRENRYHRTEHARDVVRVPLADGLDGFLAIADPDAATGAVMEVAERGVVLARYPLALGEDALPPSLPIRLLIDAPRMPTNASRSQVQRDSHPIASAERGAADRVPVLVAELAARLAANPDPRRERAAAIALLAAVVAGFHWWRPDAFDSSPLRVLAELPLLHDAVGARRPLRSHWSGLVYRGRKPLDRELEPWVGDILWVPPGDPAERLIVGAYHDQRGLRRRLREARQQRRHRDRFFAHEARTPTVIAKTLPLHRMALGAEVAGSCVPQHVFADLAGEVCIHLGEGPSELVVLHHGREIERIEHASPVRFEVVIDAASVTPAARYRGVVRDAEYARVSRAMRAGVLRAIEAIALTNDARSHTVIQGGLALAKSLGVTIAPPLATAPAWRSLDGDYLPHAALAGVVAVGVVEPSVEVAPVAGRILLRCDPRERERLAACAPELLQITYGSATARPADPDALASKLAQSSSFALAITDETRVGAIAPAGPNGNGSVTLHHRGVALFTRHYVHALVPCTILVDSDTIVPRAQWDGVLQDGSAAGGYLAWEHALVRAAARALVGDRPLELLGPRDVDVHGALGRMLCAVLAGSGAIEVLGAELFALLRARRIWPVLGDPDPHSADQLRARFPAMIPYVGHGATPIAGFSPLVADDLVASAVATLAGLPVREASLELEIRRHAEVRAAKLALHREKPVQPLALSQPGETVEIAGPIVRGVVGVGWPMEIQVFVEGRPFHAIRPDRELPLRAAVEIDAAVTMPAFDGIPDDVTQEIVARVIDAAPALIVAIATSRPHVLGDLGPARRLLASCAATLDAETVAVLRAAPIFATVQRGRTSIDAAVRPHLPITAWHGEWLPPEEDEPLHDADAAIIHLTDDTREVDAILQSLHGMEILDVTDDVVKLQATRRMARGLIPKPTVHGVAPELKRSLLQLGDIGAALGHGEIALVSDEGSSALLHVGGELRKVVPIDVAPSIQIAIEAPDLIERLGRDEPLQSVLHQLRALKLDGLDDSAIPQAQELALRLVRTILSEVPIDSLEPRIRRNLVRAMFRGVLPPADLAGVPLFETTIPSWIDPIAVDDQIARFGDVWSVPHQHPTPLPLDEHRVVLRIDPFTRDLALEHGVPIIDATEELALDAVARRNRDKPRATTLVLADSRPLLGQAALDGDGITSPRGFVGILHPAAAHLRGLYTHRAMQPFTPIPDTGTWPIVATIDDARFVPDRTWDRPVDDSVWRSAVGAVREASRRAFTALMKPPADALGVQLLLGQSFGDYRFTSLRGALWIAGPPLSSPRLHVIGPAGTRDWAPPGETGVTGIVYTYSNDQRALDATLEAVCATVHGLLVRYMARRPDNDRSIITAHAAHALALGRLSVEDAARISFPCFHPRPLYAIELVSLFAGTTPVPIVDPAGDRPGVVDDDGLLSRVVIWHLRDRIQRPTSRAPAREEPPPPPRHPRQHVLDAIVARFADVGLDVSSARLVARASPMFAIDGHLHVASEHPRLIELGAALAARSPWASSMLDAIVAHGMTVLNVAFTSVTDAMELHAIGTLLGDA